MASKRLFTTMTLSALVIAGLASTTASAAEAPDSGAPRSVAPSAPPVVGLRTTGPSASPAAAEDCPAGWFCAFAEINYRKGWLGGTTRGVCYTPFNPGRKSIVNHTNFYVTVYNGEGCTGGWRQFAPGERSPGESIRSVRTV
ncbi:peptidase inhibitor family I36 protein [Kribbella monticola]|uniref:peptidase inhibitor family I36 protein n=1 Tax=Kribbella monticola TaxID=2185285 RepID=UPI000DD3159C|nr:peptidase inhibitor family I36 protein [Kribbella monticola]